MKEDMTSTVRCRRVMVLAAIVTVCLGSAFSGSALAYDQHVLISNVSAMTVAYSSYISLAPTNAQLPLQQSQSETTPLSISITPGNMAATPGSTVKETFTASGGNSAHYNIVLFDSMGNVLVSAKSNTLIYTYTVPPPSYGNNINGFAVSVYDASHNVATRAFYIESTSS